MKIENNGINPLNTQRPDASGRVEKKNDAKATQTARGSQDTVQMSEDARLLAKARAALGNSEDANSERVAQLKKQIENGDYTVQVSELARKLAAKIFQQ